VVEAPGATHLGALRAGAELVRGRAVREARLAWARLLAEEEEEAAAGEAAAEAAAGAEGK